MRRPILSSIEHDYWNYVKAPLEWTLKCFPLDLSSQLQHVIQFKIKNITHFKINKLLLTFSSSTSQGLKHILLCLQVQ
jgi:hypothetical protein